MKHRLLLCGALLIIPGSGITHADPIETPRYDYVNHGTPDGGNVRIWECLNCEWILKQCFDQGIDCALSVVKCSPKPSGREAGAAPCG